jgi:hypothetical protein
VPALAEVGGDMLAGAGGHVLGGGLQVGGSVVGEWFAVTWS